MAILYGLPLRLVVDVVMDAMVYRVPRAIASVAGRAMVLLFIVPRNRLAARAVVAEAGVAAAMGPMPLLAQVFCLAVVLVAGAVGSTGRVHSRVLRHSVRFRTDRILVPVLSLPIGSQQPSAPSVPQPLQTPRNRRSPRSRSGPTSWGNRLVAVRHVRVLARAAAAPLRCASLAAAQHSSPSR